METWYLILVIYLVIGGILAEASLSVAKHDGEEMPKASYIVVAVFWLWFLVRWIWSK